MLLISLVPQFQKVSKRKRRVLVGDTEECAEEVIPTEDIPQKFKMFVQDAIEKYNRKSNINSIPIRTSEHTWKNTNGDVFDYSINAGDVRQLDNILEKQNYTLAVGEIPYGLKAPGSEYDEIPFRE